MRTQPATGATGYSDDNHLLAAVAWLERAQDAMKDGGVCGRYKLASGWTSSYPETTGYIVPTFLQLRRALNADRFHDRAHRAIEFLLRLQLPDGGFPGGEVDQNRTEPSPFNTAQIMHGLQAWAIETGDTRCVEALRKAGNWLCELQDADGAWRKYFYGGIETTYSAHLTCWLAEAGEFLSEERFLDAARKHLTWVLQHFDSEHKWFDRSGFERDDHQARSSFTHTIAYTIWGVLRTAEVLSHHEWAESRNGCGVGGIAASGIIALAARCAGPPMARCVELRLPDRKLPVRADLAAPVSQEWRPSAAQRGDESPRPRPAHAADDRPEGRRARWHRRFEPDLGKLHLACLSELGGQILY